MSGASPGTMVKLLLCLLMCGAVGRLAALDPAKPISQFAITSWTGSDGLPSLNIKAVLQTRDGYLWLATDGGLVRFDGNRFETYSMSNSKIAGNAISSLWEDRTGKLWVGLSAGGVCQLHSGLFHCLGKETALPPGQVRAITGDDNGTVWIGVVGRGVGRFRDGRLTMLTAKDGMPSNSVTNLLAAHDGSLWISTFDAGAAVYKDGHFRLIQKPSIPSDLVWGMSEDRSGAIWLATFGGLCRLKDASDRTPIVYGRASGLPDTNVTRVFIDKSGKIWACTNDGGLSRLDKGVFTTLRARDGLADNSVLALTEDEEGDLWAGTKSGLNRLRDQPFSLIGEREGLAEDAVRLVFEDKQLDLWAGTYNRGLALVLNRGVEETPRNVPIGRCSPLAAFEDHNGDLWLGCAGGSVVRRRFNRTVAQYSLGDGRRFVEVNAIAELGGRRLFAATFGSGLAEFRHGAWIPKAIRPDTGNITALLSGPEGLWVASLSGGIFLVKPEGAVVDYPAQAGTSTPLSMSRDSDQSIWVVSEHGLAHISQSILRLAPLSGTPLADDTLYNLLDDGRGSYWISSSRGVYQVPRAGLRALLTGKTRSMNPLLYDSVDGVRAVNSVGFAQPTAGRTHDGRLWFATTKGLLFVDPAHLIKNRLQPQVHVEAILADDKPIPVASQESSFQIPANRHRLEIQYSALSLKAPEKVRFAYRLEGFDPDWIDARQRRSAFYTDLPPGGYLFRVKACNNDGVWNEAGAQIPFRKQPFYYQMRWFQLSCLAAAALMAGLVYKRHMDRVRREILLVQTAIAQEQQKAAREKLEELATANQVLRKAAGKLTQAAEPERFLDVFLREAIDLAGASAGAVYRRIGDTELEFASLIQDGVEKGHSELAGLPCAQEKREVSRDDASGYFARLMNGEVTTWQVDSPGECCPPLTLQYHRDHGHRAVWEFPFSVDDRVEGAIALAFRTAAGPSESVVQTLTALNSQLAIALKLTRLNEESKRVGLALEREQTLTEERSRVAREIHDTLAQSFTGILMQLQAAAEYFNVNSKVAAACVERAESMARDGLAQARASVMSLSPQEPQLDLVDRIRSTAERALTDTGTRSEVIVAGPAQPLDAIVAANVLRICQEALSNAQRYSGAGLISITLRFEPKRFSMIVHDDGSGFETVAASGLGFGLSGMETRANRIGGQLSIRSKAGSGTTVELEVPLRGLNA